MSLHIRALGAISVLAVAATLLGVVPAQADNDHFNSSITTDVPPGGGSTVTSPSMDKGMKKAKVSFETPLSDEPEFEDMALTLLQQPTPGKRLTSCVVISVAGQIGEEAWAEMTGTIEEYEAVADSRFIARMLMCLRMAQLISEILAEQNARPLRAGSACGQVPLSVKEKITKSGGKYRMTAKSLASRPSKSRVKVGCTVNGTKASLTVKPKKKASTLRKALASTNLGTGVAIPSSAQDGAKVKVAFSAP